MLLAGAAAARSVVLRVTAPAKPSSQLRARSAAAAAAAAAAAPLRAMASLVFAAHGEPADVLELRPGGAPAQDGGGAGGAPLGPGDVRLELIMAPINPSDINTVQGKYPLKPPLPGVPGHEGAMRVAAAGPEVAKLRPGDRVVPLAPAVGTWREGGVFKAADWHAVPAHLSDEAAATLCINPPTALSMLENFVDLKPGDTVAQNGATSAVGQHVIQICKAKGIRTVNIIRDRPDWDATVAWLKGMGADIVVKEEDAKGALAAAGLPAPALGLNCVGGSPALAVAKLLREGGTLVTYGAMGLQPIPVGAALLIFKDLSFKGFWLSGRWAAKAGPEGRAALLDRVAALYADGALEAPKVQTFPLSQWREALAADAKGRRNAKVAFVAG